MGVVEQSAKVVASEFEKDTGIKVNFVRMSGGGDLEPYPRGKRIIPRPVYGMAAAPILSLWRKRKDFWKHTSHPMQKKIKPEFKDADGYWTGIYQGYLGFILDGRYFDEHKLQPPTSWDDLLKPEFTGQIVMGNPGSASTGYVVVSAIVQSMGEEKRHGVSCQTE